MVKYGTNLIFVLGRAIKFQGVCVNDFLYKGPTMRNSLVGVLMHFRTYLCALISDIRKLYYQCEVKKDQQDFFAIFVV